MKYTWQNESEKYIHLEANKSASVQNYIEPQKTLFVIDHDEEYNRIEKQ